jgi:hypothetical protein
MDKFFDPAFAALGPSGLLLPMLRLYCLPRSRVNRFPFSPDPARRRSFEPGSGFDHLLAVFYSSPGKGRDRANGCGDFGGPVHDSPQHQAATSK